MQFYLFIRILSISDAKLAILANFPSVFIMDSINKIFGLYFFINVFKANSLPTDINSARESLNPGKSTSIINVYSLYIFEMFG